MVDEINTPATAVAATDTTAATSAAPAVAAPINASAETPAQAATPAPVSPSAAPEPTAAPAPTTVLGAEPPAPTATPEPTAAPAPVQDPNEIKKDESSQSVEPAPLPSYEPWKLPEGATLDEAKATEFNSLLAEMQTTTKAEQAFVQEFGQKLIERHISEVKETVDRLHESYQQAWRKQTDDWKQAFISDPEIGGNRQETTVTAANDFISTYGGTPEQQKEFRALMETTGLGNHPAMIRILANAKNNAQFSAPKPIVGKPATEKLTTTQKFYGKKTG